MKKYSFTEVNSEPLFTHEERKLVDKGVRGLKFNKRTHKYTLDGIQLKSATEVLKMYVRAFERGYISSIVANKYKKNSNKKLSDARTVRKLWDAKGERKSALGTSLHAFCEAYWLAPNEVIPVHEIEWNAKKLMDWIMKTFVIEEMEVNRGNRKYMIGYTMDVVMRHKVSGDVYIGDFKFSETFTQEQYKEIKGRQANYLLESFRNLKLREVTKDKGEIQLNMYKRFYEMDTNSTVRGMLLFHIDGTGNKDWYGDAGYKVYVVRDLTKYLDIMLKPHENVKVTVMNRL